MAAHSKSLITTKALVSTHSHPKVAANSLGSNLSIIVVSTHSHPKVAAIVFCGFWNNWRFQHTATRRWLLSNTIEIRHFDGVSTHSHPKVAAAPFDDLSATVTVSTHSHPKVAALRCALSRLDKAVSTHSHPKVAAIAMIGAMGMMAGFNTQPPEGGCFAPIATNPNVVFVSTHSHPKVAAIYISIL